MILALHYQWVADEVKLPEMSIPKPLVILTCHDPLISQMIEQDKYVAGYRKWLRTGLRECRRKGFYAIVKIPLQYLGTDVVTDKLIEDFMGCPEDGTRDKIMAVHLTRGQLSEWQYILRTYAALRAGLTYELMVDSGIRPGSYTYDIWRAALGVWGIHTAKADCVLRALWIVLKKLFHVGQVNIIVVDRIDFETGESRWRRLNKWLSSKSMLLRFSKASGI